MCGYAQRGKVPIVTGGTGFYLRWFIHGKPRTPVSTAQTAKEVEDFLKQVPAHMLFSANNVCPASLTCDRVLLPPSTWVARVKEHCS